MIKHPHIRLSSLVTGLSSAIDLVSQSLVNHHLKVTVFAGKIAALLALSDEEISNLGIAGSLHDVGLVASNDIFQCALDRADYRHAEIGYLLLKEFKPFQAAAEMVRYHHVPWGDGKGEFCGGHPVPLGSHILHLADRVAVQLEDENCYLHKVKDICRGITLQRGHTFHPAVVDAFLEAAEVEAFWLEGMYTSSTPNLGIGNKAVSWNVELNLEQFIKLSDVFRCIIDFRSSHTATHSKSVACIAESLARLVGFSGYSCGLMHVAGNLHDLGKLAVPVEILEKKAALSPAEVAVVKSHPYHTYRVLSKVSGMEELCVWASLHHECLDKRGYPFHLGDDQLTLGSRIVAVSDVFAALTEDRSYRPGMQRAEVFRIMNTMVADRKLDPHVVSLLDENFEDLNGVRRTAYESSLREFENMRTVQRNLP